MNRVFKEPLFHFLVLGALLFAGYNVLNRNGAPKPERIVISQGQLASMMEAFSRTWQRPPTSEEWESAIRERVRQEVFYREALALGLDKDDLIIQRRLQQKMQFITDDVASASPPTDVELIVYMQAHIDKFRVEQQFTFTYVYLNPEKHGEELASDAAQLLADLNRAGGNADVSALGDSFMLDRHYDALPTSGVARLFGQDFASKLGKLATGQWQGPVESGYGEHLVFVSERTEERQPALAEVREAVSREWANTVREQANEKYYEELLKRYAVTIEPFVPVETKTLARMP